MFGAVSSCPRRLTIALASLSLATTGVLSGPMSAASADPDKAASADPTSKRSQAQWVSTGGAKGLVKNADPLGAIHKDPLPAELVARSGLLATASHEIRTPLSGLIGMAELLGATPLAPDQRSYLDAILASAQALAKSARSLRKPYPGCSASHPVRRAASMTAATSR